MEIPVDIEDQNDNIGSQKIAQDWPRAFREIVQARKSVRAFSSRPVDRELLKEILEVASYAPSNCNTQPWKVHLVAGRTKDVLSKALVEDATYDWDGEVPTFSTFIPDMPYLSEKYEGAIKERQIRHANDYQAAFGIDRSDRAGRNALILANLRFFGAPHALFLCMPDWGNEREASDVGQFAQTLMLAFTAYGLASVPQTMLGLYAPTVRRVLNISESEKLLFGISFGYEDTDRSESRFDQARANLIEFVTFYD